MTDRETLARELRETHAAVCYPPEENWHPAKWESLTRGGRIEAAWLAVADRVMEKMRDAAARARVDSEWMP